MTRISRSNRLLIPFLLVVSWIVVACTSTGITVTNTRHDPPNIPEARSQMAKYIASARGRSRATIELYSNAILSEHGVWLRAAVSEFEIEAKTYAGTEPFMPYLRPAIAGEIFGYLRVLEGSTSVYYFNSGQINNMPATSDLVALSNRWDQAMRDGSDTRGQNIRLARQREQHARAQEQQVAREERAKKFDTVRRRAEQCQDTTTANAAMEPSPNEMCGALLADFDWRAQGYEESMGWLDAIIKGNSAEAIRNRGSLLVNISNFSKHGQCTPSSRENRRGFSCSFSATVIYSDHEVTRTTQAISGASRIDNARGFFYVSGSGRWQTDQ